VTQLLWHLKDTWLTKISQNLHRLIINKTVEVLLSGPGPFPWASRDGWRNGETRSLIGAVIWV